MENVRVAVLIVDPNQARSEMADAPASAPVIRSVEELAARSEYRAVLVEAPACAAVEAAIRAVRVHPRLSLMPLFLRTAIETPAMTATDGVPASWGALTRKAGEILALLSTLPPAEALDQDEALLRFLFSRPGTVVAPVQAYTSRKLYRYPLLESFAQTQCDSFLWSHSLLDRGLLEAGKLISRVRLCPACGSARLNYIDRCPNCKGIDIRQTFFLHCFTCGNVAPQAEFHHEGALHCPKCNSVLRHIGADYDRALENYLCHSCRHICTEPDVVAACMDCDTAVDPAELEKLNIAEMALSEKGRLAVRSGNLQNIYAFLDRLNYVNPEYFARTLDWTLGLGQRHKETVFSLLQLRMDNMPEIVVTLGRARAALLMETFAERLRRLIRTTDLSTRTAENVFLLLLPHTEGAKAEILRDRIRKLSADVELPDKKPFQVSLRLYAFPRDYLKGENAELVLSRLAASDKDRE